MKAIMIMSLILNVLLLSSGDEPCGRVESQLELGTKGRIERK